MDISITRGFFFQVAVLCIVLFSISGCAARQGSTKIQREAKPVCSATVAGKHAREMGYSIQVGAFAQSANAARLSQKLNIQGLPAFYFAHSSGLYKVRFGNYENRILAVTEAKKLKHSGAINSFYIVSPHEYVRARGAAPGNLSPRDEIVATAKSYLGLPYLWHDSKTDARLDCSGLALAVYQLNGYDLPRTSRAQYAEGTRVSKAKLKKGDLVFFATTWKRRITHVGIYIGDGQFIHAPGRGKRIRQASLNANYFQKNYRGACTYLP